MSEQAKRDAQRVGRGRELALLLLCTVEQLDEQARVDAAALAFEAPAADEGALAQLERLRSDASARQTAKRLVDQVLSDWAAINAQIEGASDRWRLDRMHQVDRNMLRIAVVELRAAKPGRAVVAAEATRLAGTYGAEHSARFVNGVVDSLAKLMVDGGA